MKLSQDILNGIRKQDRRAQYDLYYQFYGLMKSISLRYQCDEQSADAIVNESFLKVIKNFHNYDSSASFTPWLSRIVVNTNIDACRKKSKIKKVLTYDSEMIDQSLDVFVFNKASEELDAEELRSMIAKLPETTRIVFNMFALDGYKHREIAEALQITEGTSKWHLNSARKKVKEMIETQCEHLKIVHYEK